MDIMDFEVVPHGADAQVDLKRGVVISTTKIVEPEKPGPFGTTSLHESDYPLYYFNIQANAAARIAAYMAK
ncbi:MAG: hypothetical protein J6Y88_01860 [Bacteroidales bacterium]|nr:hypothetical protein [Bacteroidales bacterium]